MVALKNKKKNPLTQPLGRTRNVVGLDVEAGSIAATEVAVNGAVSVERFGVAPLAAGAVRDGEVHDAAVLGDAIKELFTGQKFPRDVRIGIANQRVAVRTIRLPLIEDPGELETAVRFAAQDHIPMPLDRAVLDWQVIPSAPGDPGDGIEVVAVAARREMLAGLIEAVNRAGLRLAGIDHSSFALIRALRNASPAPEPATAPLPAQADPDAEPEAPLPVGGRLYCHLGDITNLAVARESYCVFSRVLGFGIEGIAQALSASSGLNLEHARQWLAHVGLEDPVEQIEGDQQTVAFTRDALASGVATLVEELRRSLTYYAALEDAVRVDDVVVAGPGTTIPGLVARLQRELPVPLHAAVPPALSSVAGHAAGRLTLSYGLGLEE
jgi:type IV pilus assembly protein PilM